MKRILKIGDKIYAQSLQKFSASYLSGFPQREQFLTENCKNLSFTFFRHSVINSLDDVVRERKRLYAYLRAQKFDALLIDNPLSGLLIEEDCAIPLVFDSIDWYDEMYVKEFGEDARYHLLRYGIAYLVKKASKVVSQSPINLAMLKQIGLRTKKTAVIPNGYDKTIFYPYSPAEILKLKKKFSNTYHVDLVRKRVVVYTGKLGKYYGDIRLIARAIPDDYILLIVGDGPIKHEIPKRKNVVICGAVPYADVPTYTNIADVLVFPVDSDCSPIAISEYLAVGKPIVMGKGRMNWLLKNGKTGYFVKQSMTDWKKGIIGATALQKACLLYNTRLAKNLSWQNLGEKFARFIEE